MVTISFLIYNIFFMSNIVIKVAMNLLTSIPTVLKYVIISQVPNAL